MIPHQLFIPLEVSNKKQVFSNSHLILPHTVFLINIYSIVDEVQTNFSIENKMKQFG